ncbi:hypothetical protein [Prosthecomicrobium hirschii]|uniref:hypothetical protein n=1 Tax=Prosthecodimorpha hirschii TaxID=665126 RepID=UPI00221EC685|nr:hypothetical protein [Prosthecomicrobium hirschii]MCW1844150.1 hypothetical protein [Prosthecomicrobium hirschii]
MSRFTLDIETENAAFGETDQERRDEVARILIETANKIKAGAWHGAARDANGNRVGSFGTED